jgi:hypothetical protein
MVYHRDYHSSLTLIFLNLLVMKLTATLLRVDRQVTARTMSVLVSLVPSLQCQIRIEIDLVGEYKLRG